MKLPPSVKIVFFAVVLVFLTAPAVQAQMAKGESKFLGNILSKDEDPNFAIYWNQVTPEDNGKLGYVESIRGVMDWSVLDGMYRYARDHGFPFKEHTFVWGRQQPDWINSLSATDQRMAITKWIKEFGRRYPDVQFIDVVNEPLHYPPLIKTDWAGMVQLAGIG